MTIYRKVLCSERLPDKEGRYITNINSSTRFKDNSFNNTASLGCFKNLKIVWWLEEIELPSEEEISEKAMESTCHMAFWKCYEYILNKLK